MSINFNGEKIPGIPTEGSAVKQVLLKRVEPVLPEHADWNFIEPTSPSLLEPEPQSEILLDGEGDITESGSHKNNFFSRGKLSAGILGGLAALAVSGIPEQAAAQRSTFGPPQIGLLQVKRIVYLRTLAECKQKNKDIADANPGFDKNGKCTVPIQFITHCRVGPLGKKEADPPLKRNEGYCTAAFRGHVENRRAPEPIKDILPDIDYVCSSYRVGVRLLPAFVRTRGKRAQIKWFPHPDPRKGYTVKFNCVMINPQ